MKKGNELQITGKRLETLRRGRGKKWTQEYVAKELVGCTPKTYRSWELGTTLPNTKDLLKLSKIFNVSTDYILGLSDYEKTEYGMIAKMTGLNEDAVKTLFPSEDIDHDRMIDALNVLLPSVNFRNMLEDILEYFKKEKLLFQLHKNTEKQIAKTLEEYKPNLPLLGLIESMTHEKEISELHAQRNFNYVFSELQRYAKE